MKAIRMHPMLVVSSVAALFLLAAGVAVARQGVNANARFCQNFDRTVIMGGRVDEASKYLTADFKEHNVRLKADSRAAFVRKLKTMRAFFARRPRRAAPAGGRAALPMPTVLTSGNLVVFITTLPQRPDPNHPGRELPAANHIDVYRLRHGKIAEHWD